MDDARRDAARAELQRRTAELIAAAGELGDAFLQYLYGLALRHIEETRGIAHAVASDTAPRDPAIYDLAENLKALAKRKR